MIYNWAKTVGWWSLLKNKTSKSSKNFVIPRSKNKRVTAYLSTSSKTVQFDLNKINMFQTRIFYSINVDKYIACWHTHRTFF